MDTKAIISAAEIGALTVIDIRDSSELRSSGTATGSLHIPLADLIRKADPSSPDYDRRIARDRPIAVYSAAGGRSRMAVLILGGLGFKAFDIGGFYNWAAAGGAVSR